MIIILEIKNLSIKFKQYDKIFSQKEICAVENLNLTVNAGEMVTIVGSSGSGKSLLAHAVLGILPYNSIMSGEIIYDKEPLDEKRAAMLRGKEIVLVPQSTAYLDPLMRLEKQILKGSKDKIRKDKLSEIFKHFHLKDEVKKQYPFEMSGGMSRRILISTALIESPRLVIADEPTPGLDLKMAMRAMEHFRELADMGAAVLIITHDLELAIKTADRIVIFNEGRSVEEVVASDFSDINNLKSPFSKALYRAMPENGFERQIL